MLENFAAAQFKVKNTLSLLFGYVEILVANIINVLQILFYV